MEFSWNINNAVVIYMMAVATRKPLVERDVSQSTPPGFNLYCPFLCFRLFHLPFAGSVKESQPGPNPGEIRLAFWFGRLEESYPLLYKNLISLAQRQPAHLSLYTVYIMGMRAGSRLATPIHIRILLLDISFYHQVYY